MKSLPTLLGLALSLVFWIPHIGAAKEPPLRSAAEQEVEDRGTDFVAKDRFATALKAWLDDDDPVALPMLSRLANEGHIPAQIFLGRIANRVASEYVEGLSREDRNRLLRASGGLSGTSWLSVASDGGSTLARAFLASQFPPYTIDDVRSLLDHAETAEATDFLLRSVNSGPINDIEELLEDDRISDWSIYSVWLSVVNYKMKDQNNIIDQEKLKRLTQYLSRTDSGGILVGSAFFAKFGYHFPKTEFPEHLKIAASRLSGDTKILLKSSKDKIIDPGNDVSLPFQSLKSYCSIYCHDEVPKCMYDAVVLVGGYNALWKLMSPAESIISTSRYHESRRVAADVARTIQSKTSRWGRAFKEEVHQRSCAAAPTPKN